MWIELFKRVMRIKIFVSHVIIYQRVTLAEVNLNNQVDMMTHVRILVTVFLQPSLLLPSRLMMKVTMMAEMEKMCGLSNIDLCSRRAIWLQRLLSAQSVSSRDQH